MLHEDIIWGDLGHGGFSDRRQCYFLNRQATWEPLIKGPKNTDLGLIYTKCHDKLISEENQVILHMDLLNFIRCSRSIMK